MKPFPFVHRMWEGLDAVVIGGGPSVRDFDMTRLWMFPVVGTNDAYKLGEAVVSLLVFGDYKWWTAHKERLEMFSRPIIGCGPKLEDAEPEAPIYFMPRKASGFHRDAFGWNGNTGSLGINLALILGASRVLLLGFDMGTDGDGKTHWHDDSVGQPTEENFQNHIQGIEDAAGDIEKNFPGQQVINLNPESRLECFPKKTWNELYYQQTIGG